MRFSSDTMPTQAYRPRSAMFVKTRWKVKNEEKELENGTVTISLDPKNEVKGQQKAGAPVKKVDCQVNRSIRRSGWQAVNRYLELSLLGSGTKVWSSQVRQ